MLQRKGRRSRVRERCPPEISQSVFIYCLCGLSAAHCLLSLVSADILYCVFYCVSKQSEFLQTNTLINHRSSLDEEKNRRRKAEDKSNRQGPWSKAYWFFSLLYLFNVLCVNIRQGKGGDCRHTVFAFSERKLVFFPLLSFHLFLTEVTAIMICQPFDRFCHQLAAKSGSPQTKMKQFICRINHYLALVSSLFIQAIISSREKIDACNAAHWSSLIFRLPALVPGAPVGGE